MPMASLTDTATVTITLIMRTPLLQPMTAMQQTWVLNSLWMLPMGFWQMIPT